MSAAGTRHWWAHASVCLAGLSIGVLGARTLLRDSPAMPPYESPDQLSVTMRGRDYQWHFEYAGADGQHGTEDDFNSPHDLHLITGADVDVTITTDDFIYAVVMPGLDQRHIVIPGQDVRWKWQPYEVGVYDILADPLCSVRFFHEERMGRVVVQTPQAYRVWSESYR